MKAHILILFLVMSVMTLNGQSFLDDFNDGDLSGWTGTPEYFIANGSGELQLNGDCVSGGDHYVSQPLPTLGAAEWSFQLHLDFDPSAANHTRVFMQSDVPDLSGDVFGYYVRVGEDGAADVVKIWRSNGASSSVMVTGTTSVATSPTVGVKVVRTADAEWQLYVDPDGGTDYVLEGTDVDDTYTGGNYAGILCRYSSTRCDKFYFDDFYINPLYFDTDPPVLDGTTVLTASQLLVDFSEPVDEVTAETETFYTVTGGVGNPVDAVRDVADPSKVTLTFLTDFPEGVLLTLAINGVQDLAGNACSGLTADFSVYTIQYGNLVINEIMADPEPVLSLPAEEYIEIHNPTALAIDLTGCSFSDASNITDPFTGYVLPAGGFVIICDDGNVDAFSAYPNVLGVAGFPSLNNDGDVLTLYNPTAEIVHTVAYSSTWYNNAIKADGGWSLEMIDPTNTCQGIENWTASTNPSGGTPGTANAVFASNPDEDAPQLLSVYPVSFDTIALSFNENLILDDIELGNVQITDDAGEALSLAQLIIDPAHADKFSVVTTTNLLEGIVYTCIVSDIMDCSGNIITLFNEQKFGIPQPAEPQDIIINEILFNAVSGGFDFIELYNRSSKIIDLSTLVIAELKLADTTQVDGFVPVSDAGILLFPGEYVCVTENIEQVVAQYFTVDTGNFIEADIPNFDDSEGIIVLYDAGLNEIDHLHYFDDWHYALLTDEDGVSLERVNYNFSTQDASNWHSAASDKHYGTPGYQNSVFGEIGSSATFALEYAVFSPDGDAWHDLLMITYNTDAEGYTATIIVFDAQGRTVKNLVNNTSIGREGFITWDGLTNDDREAPSGIYIVYAEIFNLEGQVQRFKLKCTLARKQ